MNAHPAYKRIVLKLSGEALQGDNPHGIDQKVLVSIAGQIPPVGYLTFADKFMYTTYGVLLASFCLSLAVYRFQGKPEKQTAAP